VHPNNPNNKNILNLEIHASTCWTTNQNTNL
jgi:hypothetical protein